MLEESRPFPLTQGRRMSNLQVLFRDFSRDQFIHGNGPRAQVCIRCAVDMKIATEEETENFYSEKLRNARLSLVARRYSMFLYIPVLWTLLGHVHQFCRPMGSLLSLGVNRLNAICTCLVLHKKCTFCWKHGKTHTRV